MDFRGLDLNLLVALDALLTEKNVTHASQRIHLTQPALSNALARLRDFFGDPLLVQVGRKMELTARAQSLAKPVRDILQQVQSTISAQVTFDPAKAERKFSLAVSDYVIAVLLADLLRQIGREAPGIAFDLWPVTGNAPHELENGDVDFIIAPKPYLSANHPQQELFEEGYACIAWSENTQVHRQLSFEQYLALAHVEVRLGEKRQPGFAEMMLTRLNYERKIEVVVPSFDLLPLLVVGTDRIATMYRRQAEIYARHYPLQVLPFPLEIPAMVEMMQWHRYQDHDPGCLWLRGVL
ncbi:MAG: LysR family transcriptional regulator, partial [Acidobacteriota bacterium]